MTRQVPFSLLLLGLLLANILAAQDASYSQFFNSRPSLNPAFVGLGDQQTSVYAMHRTQWFKLADPYQTTGVFADMNFPCKSIGAGISLVQHSEGVGKLTSQAMHGQFRYDVKLDKTSQPSLISFGLQFGAISRRLNWSNLVFSGQLDPITGLQNAQSGTPNSNPFAAETTTQRVNLDASFGVSFINKKVVAGLAAHHLTGAWTNESIYPGEGYLVKQPLKTSLFVGYEAKVGSKSNKSNLLVFPNYKLEVQQNLITQSLGVIGTWNDRIYGGLFFQTSGWRTFGRSTHSLVPYAAWRTELNDANALLDISLSADLPLAGLGVDHAYSTAEIMLRYSWLNSKACSRNGSKGSSVCPSAIGGRGR